MIPWNHKSIKPFNHVSMNPRNGEPWKIGTLKLWTHSINSLSVFAGGRDKRGGPILTFPARSNHDRIKQEDLRRLVTYLSTVPRYSSTHRAVSSQAPRRRCSVRHRRPGIKPVSSLDLSCTQSPSACLGFCLSGFAEKSWSVAASAVRSEPRRVFFQVDPTQISSEAALHAGGVVSEETSAAGETSRSSGDLKSFSNEAKMNGTCWEDTRSRASMLFQTNRRK